MRKTEPRKCEQCGKEFHPKGGRIETNKWCSRKCFYDSRRIFKICETCGKQFHTVKWKNRRYCSAKCWRGDENYHPPNFKGKKHISGKGYVYVYDPDHPVYQHNREYKRIAEHRLVMEKFLGRLLYPWEIVHHKNGDKSDNRLENLEMWIQGHPNGSEPNQIYLKEIFDLRTRIAQLEAELEVRIN